MKFKKRPVVVDAFQFTGDAVALQAWVGETERAHGTAHTGAPMQFWEETPALYDSSGKNMIRAALPPYLVIFTLNGEQRAQVNDWVIRDEGGNYSACPTTVFEAVYEPEVQPVAQWEFAPGGMRGPEMQEAWIDEATHFPTQKDANAHE